MRSPFIFSLLFSVITLFSFSSFATTQTDTWQEVQNRGVLIWGSDGEGGAPYIFQNPSNPEEMIGFEVDLAKAIGIELGVKVQQYQLTWDNIIPSLERGDFDIAMNGFEITEERENNVLFSVPYYVYTEQLVVRKDETKIQRFEDLHQKRVGTLGGAVSHDMLLELKDVDIRLYNDQAAPYEDLALGRLDAVFMDLPIAAYYAAPNPKLKYLGEPMGEGFYAIVMRQNEMALKEEIDKAIARL